MLSRQSRTAANISQSEGLSHTTLYESMNIYWGWNWSKKMHWIRKYTKQKDKQTAPVWSSTAINDNIFHYGNRAKILQCHILHIWSNYCFNGKYKICFVQSDGTSCSFVFRVKPVSVFVRMAEFFIFGHLYSIYRSRHGFIKVKTKWKAPF